MTITHTFTYGTALFQAEIEQLVYTALQRSISVEAESIARPWSGHFQSGHFGASKPKAKINSAFLTTVCPAIEINFEKASCVRPGRHLSVPAVMREFRGHLSRTRLLGQPRSDHYCMM